MGRPAVVDKRVQRGRFVNAGADQGSDLLDDALIERRSEFFGVEGIEVLQGEPLDLQRRLRSDAFAEIVVQHDAGFLLLPHPGRPVHLQLLQLPALVQERGDVIRVAKGVDIRDLQRAEMGHGRNDGRRPRMAA